MKFLLDTDSCIEILRRRDPVAGRFLAQRRDDVGISVITEGELRTGAAKSTAPEKARRAVANFLRPLHVLPLTTSDAVVYARIRAELEGAGTPIGPLDTLIAAHAVSRGLTLVSDNKREFGRVAGILLENWRTPE